MSGFLILPLQALPFAAWLVLCLGTTNGGAIASSPRPLVFNSTIACTRGDDKSPHKIDCKKMEPKGLLALIAVKRLFYGATPLASQCSRTSPKENCCSRDPDNDCVFKSDYRLDEVALKCSGKSACVFSGRSVMASRGNCNASSYPSITSFSFVEFECVGLSTFTDICGGNSVVKESHRLYLDSNNYHNNKQLEATDCSCRFHTRCGAGVRFEAVLVVLRKFNATECLEEMTFRDLKYEGTRKTYSCQDEDEISNEVMFTSKSNAASMRLDIHGNHYGRMFIIVTSSDPSSTVKMTCGQHMSADSVDADFYCDGSTPLPTTVKQTTTTTTNTTKGNQDGSLGNGNQNNNIKVQVISNELHGGAIAGVVLAAIGILLILSQAVLFLMRRHNKNANNNNNSNNNSNNSNNNSNNNHNGIVMHFDNQVNEDEQAPIYYTATGVQGFTMADPGYNRSIVHGVNNGQSRPVGKTLSVDMAAAPVYNDLDDEKEDEAHIYEDPPPYVEKEEEED